MKYPTRMLGNPLSMCSPQRGTHRQLSAGSRCSGLWAITVPKAYGGAGVSYATVARVIQTVSAADPSIGQIPQNHLDAIDHRTTLIFIGDGRNNFSDPRVDIVGQLKRRAKRVIWLSPESPYLFGTGDSDMPQYAPYCDAVYEVANLQQLADAVDKLLD